MSHRQFLSSITVLAVCATLVVPNVSKAMGGEEIRFESDHFAPQTRTAAAREPLALKVVNPSKEIIEFESFKLGCEVAMRPGETIDSSPSDARSGRL